ncbi:hypothetical protein DFH06DRAFT_1217746 [Mycena polygramma]|nr:hypothetical protein DFH06DRAFT_1217746 [Mycena polygramma]
MLRQHPSLGASLFAPGVICLFSMQDVTLPYLETLILEAFQAHQSVQGSLLDDPIATLTRLVSRSARNLHTLCIPNAKSPHLYQTYQAVATTAYFATSLFGHWE